MREFHFHWAAFFIAFGFGILAVYLIHPAVTYIDQYPNPHNVNRIVYQDLSGDCYKFKLEDATCSKDAQEQPLSA